MLLRPVGRSSPSSASTPTAFSTGHQSFAILRWYRIVPFCRPLYASFIFSFRRIQVSRSSVMFTRTPTGFSTAQQSSRDTALYPHFGATIISPFAHRSAEAPRPPRERQLVPVGAAEAGGRGPGGRGLPGHARHAVQPRQDPGLLPRVPQAECEAPLFWFIGVRFMPLFRLVQKVSD